MEARKFWGIPCEKSRIYAKKSYFFPIAEGGAKNVGVFRVKNHDFMPKNHISSNCGGRRENVGVFRVKNHEFTPKNYIFSNCGGRRENFWGISCEKSRFYVYRVHQRTVEN